MPDKGSFLNGNLHAEVVDKGKGSLDILLEEVVGNSMVANNLINIIIPAGG